LIVFASLIRLLKEGKNGLRVNGSLSSKIIVEELFEKVLDVLMKTP